MISKRSCHKAIQSSIRGNEFRVLYLGIGVLLDAVLLYGSENLWSQHYGTSLHSSLNNREHLERRFGQRWYNRVITMVTGFYSIGLYPVGSYKIFDLQDVVETKISAGASFSGCRTNLGGDSEFTICYELLFN